MKNITRHILTFLTFFTLSGQELTEIDIPKLLNPGGARYSEFKNFLYFDFIDKNREGKKLFYDKNTKTGYCKNPARYKELIDLIICSSEDDNPILVIAKLK